MLHCIPWLAVPISERELQLRSAQVQLEQAELDLEHTEVRSPVTGRRMSCEVEPGEHVQIGQVAGELYGTDVMEVPVSVLAGELQWLAPGPGPGADGALAEVTWQQAAEADGAQGVATWAGRLDRTAAGLAQQTHTATLIVAVDRTGHDSAAKALGSSPAQMALDINMYCRVTIEGRVLDRVFILPRSAIGPGGQVYVARDGKLALQKISVARFTTDSALILPGAGLKAGDRWCLCASRWTDALEAGRAPAVVLEATHARTLEWADLGDLQAHAVDQPDPQG